MRLALLGIDDAVLAIAEAGQRSGKATIVMIDATAERAGEAATLGHEAKLVSDWENVLDAGVADAVLVAGDDPTRRIEQLRRLIQLQLPALVSHPVCLSMLDAYELDMIHRESPGVLLPWIPARWHPAATGLWDVIEAGERSEIGRVEQVVLERFMPDRQRDNVLRQFAQDADMLQYLAGDATKLHALGSAVGESTAGAYLNLNVQMTCGDGLVCRWSVSPPEDQQVAQLTLVGSRGKAILQMPQRPGEPWQLESRLGGNSNRREFSGWDPAMLAINQLTAAISGELVEPTWTEAARTIELADTIDRSLKKGRTIDLHHEEFSDISTFKGTMASLGCGLLMLGLLLVVVVAIAHSIAKNAGWERVANVLGNWPYLLLGVLGVFLLMQLLLLVGKPREKEQESGVTSQESAGNDRDVHV
jgi:predicted dehydrogenase